MHVTRILVIRFSSIGDIVLCSPVVRMLKEQLDGEVEIDVITKEQHRSLWAGNPHVSSVIGIERHVGEVRELLQSTHYDYVVDLHHNIRSKQVKRLVKGMAFTVDKRNVAKWLYVRLKREVLPIGHFTERCLQSLKAFGLEDDGKGLDFYFPEDTPPLNRPLLEGFVAYAIGGQQPGKILPAPQAIALCRLISRPVVLLGGPEDRSRGEAISQALGDRVLNLCGSTSIMESAQIVQKSHALLTHDTGMMHVGTALGVKVVSMWFATTPALGFAPWRPAAGSQMFESTSRRRPTSKLGNRGADDPEIFHVDMNAIASAVDK